MLFAALALGVPPMVPAAATSSGASSGVRVYAYGVVSWGRGKRKAGGESCVVGCGAGSNPGGAKEETGRRQVGPATGETGMERRAAC